MRIESFVPLVVVYGVLALTLGSVFLTRKLMVRRDRQDGPFNIDHVVAGPAGVFAIETKGRMQRTEPAGRDGHVLRTDGMKLEFPGWSERKPIEQASRNARWLSQWLSSATGEPVRVEPVVLVPGWYVKRSDWSGVPVLPCQRDRKNKLVREALGT